MSLWASLLFLLTTLVGCEIPSGQVQSSSEAPAALYTCSMHPQVVEDEPGTCPICGMDLVDLQRGGAGEVHVEPGIVQQMGVRTAVVDRTTVFRHLRTIGEVEVGEDEVSVVNLRYSGWVERIDVDKTGDEVRAGQALFGIYSPELVAAQEEYLLALRTQGKDAALTRSARRKLELWDIAPRDIAAIEASGEAAHTMSVRAPSSGYVLHKNLVEGGRVDAGKDLYRIGNLQRIWVTAEVYEHDAPWIETDQPAQLELTNLAGQVVDGHVAYIYPTLNPRSRTLTVRLEFDNPGVRLKPGMFATVYIQYQRKDDVVAVPTEAIVHSGRRQLVFVSKPGGRFEAREISTGLQGDHRMTEVTSGLEDGDVVVTSGQFLIDSESQLQEALQKMLAAELGTDVPAEPSPPTLHACPMHPAITSPNPGKCTDCGMHLVPRAATTEERRALDEGRAQPGQYTCPMHPEVIDDEPGRCPQCGMFLEVVGE